MAKYIMLALTNPMEGRDDQYNDWYNNVAYPVYQSVPGFIPLGRFKLTDLPPGFDFEIKSNYEYMSLYLFETDDPIAFLAEAKAHVAKRGDYYFSPDIDKTSFSEPIYVSINDINLKPINNYA